MALNKQPVSINFSKGVSTKADPFQVPIGSYLALTNSVFTATGRLTKRFGFNNLLKLPDTTQTTLTTLKDNLIATGSNLTAFSEITNEWLDQGIVQPVQLSTQPLVRNSTSQSGADTAISANGLTLLVYIDNSVAYYQISDSNTGQQVIARTAVASGAKNPRAFLLRNYFIITFIDGGTPTLKYIAIPVMSPSAPKPVAVISATAASTTVGYDGYVASDTLFLAWGGTGTTVRLAYLTASLAVSAVVSLAASIADLMSVTVDEVGQTVWISYWDDASNNGYTAAYSYILAVKMAPTIMVADDVEKITSIPNGRDLTVLMQFKRNYSYTDLTGDAIRTDIISKRRIQLPLSGTGTGTATGTDLVRSVGLASKPFVSADGTIYFLSVYGDRNQINALDNSNQPTYFLMDSDANIYMRLAAANGGGYLQSQVLPSVSVQEDLYSIAYMAADFLTTVNKGTNLPAGTPVNAIYTQFGINLASFTVNTVGQHSSEIAGALHLTGGQLWEYDSVRPVEHGFQVYPENIVVTTATGSGALTAQQYFYVFTYEWTDNQGNLHRSAPSIPVSVTTTTASSTNTIKVPTLRITYKVAPNPVRIVGYRWSAAQQVYYQFTSVTSPTANSTTVDQVTFTDALADSSILGNAILYTTGGVVENVAAPASTASALFDNRLWLIDAEDQNLLWYSKQVIEAVPVEMSDLLTYYVAPTTGAQGSTGNIKALSAMDDKLIIFKKDAIYYVNGTGPDNTGANSAYSSPVFITSTVGSENPNSTVLMPMGVMFQSDKGIWLLGRDLSTKYIGEPVEQYNSNTVLSATAIPGTNQVRFVLDNSITLMYDYFVDQWAIHTNVKAISATLYNGKLTYLNSYGQVFKESTGFTDGSTPVLIGFTTSWISLAGLQGYERFYFANLLGTYYTPFILTMSFAYDYNSSPTQQVTITPDNYAPNWGGEALWGSGGPWGGPGNVFEARVFPEKQKCETFQITVQEVYDSSLGAAPGQGLSLSGLDMTVGIKKGSRTQSAAKSFG